MSMLIPVMQKTLEDGGSVTLISRANFSRFEYRKRNGRYENSCGVHFLLFMDMMKDLLARYECASIDGLLINPIRECNQRYLKSDIIYEPVEWSAFEAGERCDNGPPKKCGFDLLGTGLPRKCGI